MEDAGPSHRLKCMERVSGLALVVLLALVIPGSASAVPPAASFSVSPPFPLTFETVTFTSTSTGDVTSVAWDLDNDGFFDDGTGTSASKSFPTAGIYTVRLRVVGFGGSGEQSQLILIVNRPPNPAIAYFPSAPEEGDQVSFVSTSQDPDGTIVSQLWDLDGDGVFDDGSGPQASHTFPSPGLYTVRLRIVDNGQAQSTVEQPVQVFPRPAAMLGPFPVVRLSGTGTATGARIKRLVVQAPPGARVEVRCRGGGCGRHRQTRHAPAGPRAKKRGTTILRFRRFERRLRAHAVLEIFVTKPNTIGKYTRYVIRRGAPPLRTDLCIRPGAKRPSRCPAA